MLKLLRSPSYVTSLLEILKIWRRLVHSRNPTAKEVSGKSKESTDIPALHLLQNLVSRVASCSIDRKHQGFFVDPTAAIMTL